MTGPLLADGLLNIMAATVDDLERTRIAANNRYAQLTRPADKLDADGLNRGFGLSDDLPAVAKAGDIADGIAKLEQAAILNLQKYMRKHPLWINWGAHQKGIGEKTLARLLYSVQDPYWNDLYERPRTVSELWAYCGLHVLDGAAPKRKKGVVVNWNSEARKRIWLVAQSALMGKEHTYYKVYSAAREKYADAKHSADCVRCGPKGKPALAGSDLSDGHKDARARRIVAKEILKDLWLESRTIHEAAEMKAAA